MKRARAQRRYMRWMRYANRVEDIGARVSRTQLLTGMRYLFALHSVAIRIDKLPPRRPGSLAAEVGATPVPAEKCYGPPRDGIDDTESDDS